MAQTPPAAAGFLSLKGSRIRCSLGGIDLGLDCEGGHSFVSHAHFDHAGAFSSSKKIISTDATLQLMHARGIAGEEARRKHCTKLESDGLKIELLNAGHVLGSSMLHAQIDGTSFLYTADFKTEDSLVTKKAEPAECDVLLMEATYGNPEYRFPPREQTYAQMKAWQSEQKANGRITLFGGYALGKAQEIIKALNEHCGTIPIVSNPVAKVCEVYNAHGAELEYLRADTSEAQEMLSGAFTAVLPHHQVNSALAHTLASQYKRKVATALATGWNAGHARAFDCGACFTLSDHCDFNGLLKFAEGTGAKTIYTTHGYARELAHELRKMGKNAQALEDVAGKKGQQTLAALA
ncbi:MAG: hypothetical protein WC792_02115 [Candidatus Micrarchaeia archaeon]|jgi:putative mRNA 3-end processing factor